jgi:predicted dehydrogenase
MGSLRALPELYEIVALADTEDSKDKLYADLPRLSVDKLLALPGLQAVTVETRVEDSCAMALQAIRAGKHVHLDKPGALAHAEFKTMRLEAEQRGLTLQMGYMLRSNPAFELLFKAVRSGWLGDITEIDGMMGKLADPRTRQNIGALPGGGMFELGCHMIDAVVTLLGKPASVHAFSTPTNPGDGVQDNQLAVLEYPKTTVSLRCNHADPFGGPRRRFQVTGTKGSIEIMPMESGELTVRFSEPHESFKKGEQKLKLDVPKDRYIGDLRLLAKVIRGEAKFPWSAEHDIAVHETVMRAAGLQV